MSTILTKIAKAVLRTLPARPSAEYLPLDQITPEHAESRARGELEDERAGGFLKFFDGTVEMSGESILDLGCGYGGRTLEFQRAVGGRAIGIDVDPRMLAPAASFARSMGADTVSFVAGVGEALPLADDSIDLIFSYDVFEHVEDPERCLAECQRVLKPGGLLLLVFPPYYHPTGAHLEGYVSHVPYANVLFPSPVLLRAVDEILEERGDHFTPRPLRPGDKLYCLNGLTVGGFRRMLARSELEVVSLRLLPLFSRLNRKYDAWRMRYYAWIFTLLSRVPVVQEGFTHRVVAVLRKPAREPHALPPERAGLSARVAAATR